MPRITSVLAAILIAIVSLPFSTAVSTAVGTGITCTPPSSASLTYNPPLTTSLQTVTISASWQYGPCVSTSHPSITSGTLQASGPVPNVNCLSLLGSRPATYTITWNTGQTSTLSGNIVVIHAGATLISTTTGTVTAGVFAGSTFVHTIVYPSHNILLCNLGLGTVSSLYGQITLAITSP